MSNGACQCGEGGLKTCTCAIGQLVDRLIKIGYNTPDQWQAARELAKLQDEIRPALAKARHRLLVRLAVDFAGTRREFAERLGFSVENLAKIGFSWKTVKDNRG